MISTNQTTEAEAPDATEAAPEWLLHGADRAAAIEEMRALLDLLEAEPDVPLGTYAFHFLIQPGDAGIDKDSTAEAVCWIGSVAGALGAEVTDTRGAEPTTGTDSYMARRDFGEHVQYRAMHLTPEFSAKVAARQAAKAAAEGGAA
jgi:hypothetical protein